VESRQALADSGDAERGWPHVDPAAVPTEVERDTDDVNWTHKETAGALGSSDDGALNYRKVRRQPLCAVDALA
jgi:hypothetical protein